MTIPSSFFMLGFGVGSPADIAIVAGAIVLLFGGAKLKDFGKSLGQGIREFKKGISDDDEKDATVAATPSADRNEVK